jgi:hypothetical protein
VVDQLRRRQGEVTAFGDSNKVYVGPARRVRRLRGLVRTTPACRPTPRPRTALARKFYLYPSTADTTKYFWGTILPDLRIDRGRVRHLTYGHKPWVLQDVRKGWFTDPLEAGAPEVRKDLTAAMDTVARKIEES